MNLISIIIPTYNRAHLLGETLDSILVQTFIDWECIVVDDGSTDASQAIFDSYKNKDPRFRFLSRPKNKPKGANACRNIGLQQANGTYIVFFDSDDLMTPDHLEVKYNAIKNSGYDYVITRTKFFNKDSSQIDAYYKFDQFEITPHNYVTQKINWLTLDVCIKSELAKAVVFNEQLQSGQEFNYFSKLVHLSVNYFYLDKVVSLRRHHENSIRAGLKSKDELYASYFNSSWHTYIDLKVITKKKTLQYLIKNCARFTMDQLQFFEVSKVCFYKEMLYCLGFSAMYHFLYMMSMKLFGKGYFFRSRFYKSIK